MLKESKKKRRKKLLVLPLASGIVLSGINADFVKAANNPSQTVTESSKQSNHKSRQQTATPKLVDEASINVVVAAMTLKEKASLVVGGNKEEVTSGNGEIIGTQATKVPGAAGQTQAIPRLGIPSIVFADGAVGVKLDSTRPNDNHKYYATKFPSPSVLASTWDTELVKEVGEAEAKELKAYGIDLFLAPGMNNQSYLLNRRNYEYFSEDPVVTGKMATAFVKGVQGNGVGATIKHFAAFNQRTNLNVNAIVSQRALREIYLKGFEMTVKEAKPWAVMNSYNKINGTYATENKELLRNVLREEFGFKGFTMTDWETGERDRIKQMNAGTNLLMPGTATTSQQIIDAVQSGALNEKVLDRNVKELLQVIVKTPSFKGEQPLNNPDLNENAKVVRKAAANAMVLLKNKSSTLPITKPASASIFGTPQIETLTGGRGSSTVYTEPGRIIGIPDGLRNAGFELNEGLINKYKEYVAKLRSQDQYKGTSGDFGTLGPKLPEMDITEDAIAAAENTDVGIIVLSPAFGIPAIDRAKEDFYLSKTQQEMINKVSTAYHTKDKKVIAILNTEGPLEVESWKDKVDGILLSWQPGQEIGNAVADVITGKVNPSGKLPHTFPKDYKDLTYADTFPGTGENYVYKEGIYVGYRYNTTFKVKPSYEFGYGLSYTDFDYSNIRVTHNRHFKGKLGVHTTIKNTGNVAGKEVVQVYVSAPDGKLEKPELELRAFTKTKELKPGKKENVKFELDAKDLASFDENLSAWVVEKGTYKVKIGASSANIKGTATFKVDKDIIVERVSDVLEPQIKFDRLSKFN
ncbi:glycoside hydrolase family 3 N-terminal domain-containing protein [Priestia megaterium]|uniref:beta-glucosidase n=1 Tax=Priestia megaterium TaxID=1404 RepID=UPI0030092AE1